MLDTVVKRAAIALLIMGMPNAVFAQGSVSRIDQVSDSFRAAVAGVGDQLAIIAQSLLFSLLLIELLWKLGKTVMEGDDFGKLMGIFFKRIVVAGFFLAIVDGIPTGSGQVGIGTFIIQSAEALIKESVGTTSVKPSELFWQMLSAGRNIYDSSSGVGGIVSAAIVWVLLSILGAVVVGLMIVTYIEIYVIFTVGILSLGFGVWSVTEQFAKNFLFSAVGKTLKLFTMILMASVIAFSIESFGDLSSFEDGLITIGIVLIFAMLMSTVPQAVEQIISGIPAVSGDQGVAGAVTGASKTTGKAVGSGAVKGAKSLGSVAAGGAKSAGSSLAGRIRNIKKD